MAGPTVTAGRVKGCSGSYVGRVFEELMYFLHAMFLVGGGKFERKGTSGIIMAVLEIDE